MKKISSQRKVKHGMYSFLDVTLHFLFSFIPYRDLKRHQIAHAKNSRKLRLKVQSGDISQLSGELYSFKERSLAPNQVGHQNSGGKLSRNHLPETETSESDIFFDTNVFFTHNIIS